MTDEERREELLDEVLRGLVRVGTVTDRDMGKRLVRVYFPDEDYTSGWLPVIISLDVTPDHEYDDPQWTEFDTEDREPRIDIKEYADHKHKIIRKPYMPKVGDEVLTLYIPVFNADGFVLGGIQKWRK